ncbi:MAG: glycosyltransferase, partial [Actinomycetia bacterium]|nr:glycosyltransferase [Actinomycetes bacterium]
MGDHDHTPLCSVIVPLYNKEQTIRDCLASALTQSISDLEVLVIDDGSTDAGAAVVEELAREDERLALIRQENAGPSAARNAGLERAQGACVCFLDADDLLAPGFLEELIACMKREHTEVARCAQLFTDPQGRQRVRSSSDQDCSIPGSRLYRRLFAELEVPLMSA